MSSVPTVNDPNRLRQLEEAARLAERRRSEQRRIILDKQIRSSVPNPLDRERAVGLSMQGYETGLRQRAAAGNLAAGVEADRLAQPRQQGDAALTDQYALAAQLRKNLQGAATGEEAARTALGGMTPDQAGGVAGVNEANASTAYRNARTASEQEALLRAQYELSQQRATDTRNAPLLDRNVQDAMEQSDVNRSLIPAQRASTLRALQRGNGVTADERMKNAQADLYEAQAGKARSELTADAGDPYSEAAVTRDANRQTAMNLGSTLSPETALSSGKRAIQTLNEARGAGGGVRGDYFGDPANAQSAANDLDAAVAYVEKLSKLGGVNAERARSIAAEIAGEADIAFGDQQVEPVGGILSDLSVVPQASLARLYNRVAGGAQAKRRGAANKTNAALDRLRALANPS